MWRPAQRSTISDHLWDSVTNTDVKTPKSSAAVDTEAIPKAMSDNKEKAKTKTSSAWNPTSLTWSEKHSKTLEKIWGYVPEILQGTVLTLAMFLASVAMTGDWLVMLIHLRRQLGWSQIPELEDNEFEWSLKYFRLENLWQFIVPSLVISYGVYFGIGGFLHWYFYVRQRDKAKEWKCQPNSWLSTELEINEIVWGTISLLCTGTMSGVLACYISNGGYSTVYHKFDEYGWPWFFLQWPIIFIYQDYMTYWNHRLFHIPFLYKHFHKLHHAYKHPTAFSVTAIHPVEIVYIQLCAMVLPLLLLPCHWVYIIALYTYYHGIIDHSGINFKAYWWQPWQPDAIFHDNHHQYFHVNFGFNIKYWDKIHGTYRRKDRIYTEETFYGQGKDINKATADEINADLVERTLENPKAYRGDKLEFLITKEDIKKGL